MTRCRVCGCTEVNACNPPCGWAEADLCSSCFYASTIIAEWMDIAVRANITGLVREAKNIYSSEALMAAITPPQRRRRKGAK